jgi:hypothetical protein
MLSDIQSAEVDDKFIVTVLKRAGLPGKRCKRLSRILIAKTWGDSSSTSSSIQGPISVAN